MQTIAFIVVGVFILLALFLNKQMSGARGAPDMAWSIYALSAVAIAVSLISKGVFFTDDDYLHDLWTIFDIIYRTHQGLHSSIDYFNPIGPLMEWVYRAALAIAAPTARIFNLGNVLVALIAAGLGWAMLRKQANRVVVALVVLLVITQALSGRDVDAPLSILKISQLAPYNRWGWALLCPVMMRGLLLRGEKRDWPGDVACAIAIVLMVLLKITYAAAGIGLLGVAAVLRTARLRDVLLTFGVAAGVLVLVDLLTHGQVRAYLADLRFTAGLPESRLSTRKFKFISTVTTELMPLMAMSVALLYGFNREEGTVRQLLKLYLRPLLLLVAASLAAGVVLTQNNDMQDAPVMALLPLAVLEWTAWHARALHVEPAGDAVLFRQPAWVAVALLVFAVLPHADLAAVLFAAGKQAKTAAEPAFAGTEFQGLALGFESDPVQALQIQGPSRSTLQYWQMIDGVKLLKDSGMRPDQVVVALNFSNPFPMLLHSAAVRHVPVWLNKGRVFSPDRYMPAETFFDHVDLVMQASNDDNVAQLMQIYGDYIRAHYTVKATSPQWTLWERKP